jgi:hypothetical protein
MLRVRSILPIHAATLASLSLVLAISTPARAEEAAKPDGQKEAPAKEAGAAAEKPAAGAPAPAPRAANPALVTVKAEPFPENTTVHGEVKTDLQGVWLLLTRAEVVPGKFRNFPQILKISKGKDGLAFQTLDLQLPPDVTTNFQQADKALSAWDPSKEMRANLGKSWASLPKVTEKTVNDPPRGKVDYMVSTPDRYSEAFGAMNPNLDAALKDSTFSMQIVETYKPINEVTDSRISQLMQRKVVYAVKSAKDDVVQGSSVIGFLASGNGQPLPLQFGGQFVMYRLAKLS